MKDAAHHRKHVQRKILQSLRKEQNGNSQENAVVTHRASVDYGTPASTFAYSKKKKF